MGKVCDKLRQATADTWETFSPKDLELPDCVRQLLEFVYPTVDWDRVTFHIGFPHVIRGFTNLSDSDRAAITLPSTFSLNHIDIYLRPDTWGMCSCEDLGLYFVHEGFHVLQITDLLGGWGLGLVRPMTMVYLTCWVRNGFNYWGHSLEEPAYRVAGCSGGGKCLEHYGINQSLFESCCGRLAPADLPCDCSTDPPGFNAAGLNRLKLACPDLVQQSSGLNFWKQMAECIPGLQAIREAAEKVYEKTCKGGDEGQVESKPPRGPGSGPTDPDNPPPETSDQPDERGGFSVPVKFIVCLFGLLVAGFLYLVYGLYFVFWLLLSLAVAFLAWFGSILVMVVGLFVTGLLGAVTGLVCILEWIWNNILKPLWNAIRSLLHTVCDRAEQARAACDRWEKVAVDNCDKWADEGHKECAKLVDEGYQDCAYMVDEGYKKCDKKIKKCKWTSPWNCVAKWICKASHWVSNLVCKAYHWVAKLVCKAWYWIPNMVCKFWIHGFAMVCKGSMRAVKAATCW